MIGGSGSANWYVIDRALAESELKVVKSDDTFTDMIEKEDSSLDFLLNCQDEISATKTVVNRNTDNQESNYLERRLGIMIDASDRTHEQIIQQARGLRSLGYDTYSIFINSSLGTVKKRYLKENKTVPEEALFRSWTGIQQYMGRLYMSFKGNMDFVDNNNPDDDEYSRVSEIIEEMLGNPIRNYRVNTWIVKELGEAKGREGTLIHKTHPVHKMTINSSRLQ